eukprot:scaffold1154_cov310-Pinguiococcus_pyrenoidosus.AAC.53
MREIKLTRSATGKITWEGDPLLVYRGKDNGKGGQDEAVVAARLRLAGSTPAKQDGVVLDSAGDEKLAPSAAQAPASGDVQVAAGS